MVVEVTAVVVVVAAAGAAAPAVAVVVAVGASQAQSREEVERRVRRSWEGGGGWREGWEPGRSMVGQGLVEFVGGGSNEKEQGEGGADLEQPLRSRRNGTYTITV